MWWKNKKPASVTSCRWRSAAYLTSEGIQKYTSQGEKESLWLLCRMAVMTVLLNRRMWTSIPLEPRTCAKSLRLQRLCVWRLINQDAGCFWSKNSKNSAARAVNRQKTWILIRFFQTAFPGESFSAARVTNRRPSWRCQSPTRHRTWTLKQSFLCYFLTKLSE